MNIYNIPKFDPWTYLPFHKNVTKFNSVNNPCVDSNFVRVSQAILRRSDDGASGHAFDSACARIREYTYGTNMVNEPCIKRERKGRPERHLELEGMYLRPCNLAP